MGAIQATQVAQYLGVPLPTDPDDLFVLEQVTDAVNLMVPETVPRVRDMDPAAEWPADVTTAALMQAARLFTRRRSPTGIQTYTETGAVYTPRWDPDIEKLLHIGKWAPPAFG